MKRFAMGQYFILAIVSILLFAPALTIAEEASDDISSISPVDSGVLSKTEKQLNEGKIFYRDGKYDRAIEVWNKVLSRDPGNKNAPRYIEQAQNKRNEALAAPAAGATSKPAEESPKPPAPTIPDILHQMIFAPINPPAMQPGKVAEEQAPLPATTGPRKPWNITALTLKDCVTIALANHKAARIALEEVLLARMKVTEAKRALFPAATLKNEEIKGRAVPPGAATEADFRGREFNLEIQQPIFQGGKLVNTMRQAQINLAVAVKNYDKVKDDLVLEVEQAFFGVANAKTTINNYGELFAKAKEDMAAILAQQKIGVAREVDVLNIRSQHDDVSAQLTNAVNDMAMAKLTLQQQLSFEENTNFDIVSPPVLAKADYQTLDIALSECVKLAYQNRSDLYVRELMVEFQRYGVEIAKSKSRLKVDLTGSYGLKNESFITEKLELQEEYFIGLKGSLPLGPHTLEENFINQDKAPSAGQTTSNAFRSISSSLKLFDNFNTMNVTQAQIAYHKALDDLYKAQKTLDMEVTKAFYDYRKSVMSLDGYLAKQRLGEEEFKISKSQYDLNQVSLTDVLRNRIKLYEYKNGYSAASASYYTSVAKLNKAIGISGYFDPIGGKREASLVDKEISRRSPVGEKSRVSNYQAELSRAEKIVQSIKPDERWWNLWETDENYHAGVKDRWWETWEKDSKTGVVRPKSNWWQPWKPGTPTAPKARKKWWQMWEKEDSISDNPYQQDQGPFMPKPEDLVTRDMVKQLFQGGGK